MNSIFLTYDVDKQVYIFNSIFINCLEMCANTVTKAVKGRSAPWMSNEIREAMQDRNELQKQLKVDQDNFVAKALHNG